MKNMIAKLLGTHIDDNSIDSYILHKWNIEHEPYYSCIDIQATVPIHSLYRGVVIHIGITNGRYVVTVQLTSSICIRYGNLQTVNVITGSRVEEDAIIGIPDDGFIRFEYCVTDHVACSIWPVRIGMVTYYKEDPMPLISGEYQLSLSDYSKLTINTDAGYTQQSLSTSQESEINNVRSDRVVEF